jgi:hypothetical protein
MAWNSSKCSGVLLASPQWQSVVCFCFRIGSKSWLQVFSSWNAVKWPCWPVGAFYWVNIKWCVEGDDMKSSFDSVWR